MGYPPDVHEFLQGLAKTRAKQATEVRHLLIHADEDRMSEADRVICRQAMQWLEHTR